MSKRNRPEGKRANQPEETLRPAPTRRQKALLIVAAVLLAIWLAILARLAIR
jgi:hypothetical protein